MGEKVKNFYILFLKQSNTGFDLFQIHQAVLDLDAEVTTDIETEDETGNVNYVSRKWKQTTEELSKGKELRRIYQWI